MFVICNKLWYPQSTCWISPVTALPKSLKRYTAELPISFTSEDPESGISSSSYSVGSAPGLEDIVSWNSTTSTKSFDIKNLNWIFSDISCAYSAGIISAQCRNIDISIKEIIKNKN